MTELYVKSPTQASEVYSLDGHTVARAKNMFFVRFRRPDAAQTGSDWQSNMGFIVKSIDRPSVTPTVEELNQYNKKRQITTGYKVQPMRMVLYDTIDNVAMRMWDEYARYYYGDFSQDDESSYRYDVTTPNKMIDNGSGYGFVPRPDNDINSQFFFDALEVYQVFGGYFTQYDLINPRFTSFDPDDLDYSSSEASTISLTVAYESIKYRNNGRPSAISSNEIVAAAFRGKFNGNGFHVDGFSAREHAPSTGPVTPVYETSPSAGYSKTTLRPDNGKPTTGGGALSMFGNFNFGSIASIARSAPVQQAIRGDVSYQSSSSAAMSAAIGLTKAAGNSIGLSPGVVDTVSGAVGAATQGNRYAEYYVRNNVLPAVLASASSNKTSPSDEVKNTGNGIGLNEKAIGVINAQRPTTSQVGFNSSATGIKDGP